MPSIPHIKIPQSSEMNLSLPIIREDEREHEKIDNNDIDD